MHRSNYLVGERRADTRSAAGTATDAQGRPTASDPAAGEKGIDDALFLGFYLVRTVELIISAGGFSRCTRHKDAPRFAWVSIRRRSMPCGVKARRSCPASGCS